MPLAADTTTIPEPLRGFDLRREGFALLLDADDYVEGADGVAAECDMATHLWRIHDDAEGDKEWGFWTRRDQYLMSFYGPEHTEGVDYTAPTLSVWSHEVDDHIWIVPFQWKGTRYFVQFYDEIDEVDRIRWCNRVIDHLLTFGESLTAARLA